MTADMCGLLYILSCGVKGACADIGRINSLDLRAVLRQAKRHKLEVFLLSALKSAYGGVLPLNDEYGDCVFAAKFADYTRTSLEGERAALFKFLEESSIWYMPIKGEEVGRFYPDPRMRQTADCDILFDEKGREAVRVYFLERGYTAKMYKQGVHDAYIKPPALNFEMHISLFDGVFSPLSKYYKGIKSQLVKKENSQFCYIFRDEDFYVYLIAHAYKHYVRGGTGLRTLLDIYYVYEGLKDSIDFDKVNCTLDMLGLTQFERDLRALAYKVFTGDSALAEAELGMLNKILCSGAYGDLKVYAKDGVTAASGGKVNAKGKLVYVFKRLFPDSAEMRAWCEYNSPFLFRHPRLIFLAYLKRIFRAVIFKLPAAFRELSAVLKLK